MERKYRVVSSEERKTQEEAEALAHKLAELGVASQIRVDEEISDLLPLEEEQLIALGSINYLEFSDLMSQVGAKPERAKQLWGELMSWTPFITDSETPFYNVDTDAILAKANPKSRSSRLHFQRVASREERLATTSLDLPSVAHEIQGDELIKRVCMGPLSVDSLTLLINLRANQLSDTQAQGNGDE